MAKYETMLITSAALDEEASVALVAKFKTLIENNGTIDSVDEWGKRRLAYPRCAGSYLPDHRWRSALHDHCRG